MSADESLVELLEQTGGLDSRDLEQLRQFLDLRRTGQLVLSQRLDFIVSKLGGLDEMGHRLDSLTVQVEDLTLIQRTTIAMIDHAQQEFDSRTQVVLKDAEALRRTLADASASFQLAQENQNDDWHDRWQAVQSQATDQDQRLKQAEQIMAGWSLTLDQRLAELKRVAEQGQQTVTVARISRTQAIAVAVFVFLGTVVTVLGTLAVATAGKIP